MNCIANITMSTYERKSKYWQEYEKDMINDCAKLNINGYTLHIIQHSEVNLLCYIKRLRKERI